MAGMKDKTIEEMLKIARDNSLPKRREPGETSYATVDDLRGILEILKLQAEQNDVLMALIKNLQTQINSLVGHTVAAPKGGETGLKHLHEQAGVERPYDGWEE